MQSIQPQCRICGASARYSYYGALACQSCKVFFRRNAPPSQKQLKCHFTNDCVIDTNNRHICSACRLRTCFANGMCVEMIRATRSTMNKRVQIRSLAVQEKQIPTLNFLRSDQSKLTIDQWNLLSNIVHCYDEYSGRTVIERYFQEQSTLPPKNRHRYLPVKIFMTSLYRNIQLLAEKNQDFLSLSFICRSNLLRTTIQQNGSIGGMILSRQYHLLDYELLYRSAELIFRPESVARLKWLMNQLDFDETFLKLILTIVSFSPTHSTSHIQSIIPDLKDVKIVLSFQNKYVELTWKYLLYKYDYYQAVIRFSNLIRCLVLITNIVVEIEDFQPFVQVIDDAIEQIERALHL